MKSRRRQPEREEQTAFFHWAACVERQYPELRLMFAVPNGGKRNIKEAINLRAAGVKAGVPDICLPIARHGYNCAWIEMKSGEGKQSECQRQWMYMLSENGGVYYLCRSFEEAKKVVIEYLSE